MKITTREFFVYNGETGEILEKIQAYCKKRMIKPDQYGSEWWVLEHIDGEFNNSRWFEPDTFICVGDCYQDPSKPIFGTLKEGTEEAFEFFQKNGYVKETAI